MSAPLLTTDGPRWAAWREALREAVPSGAPGAALTWELGPLCVAVEPGMGNEVALAVSVATGLRVSALPLRACPSTVGAIATGDPELDGEVMLVGDRAVLAVLDAPTRLLLRGLVVSRRARIDGGVLRLGAEAASALEADEIRPTMGQLSKLAARFARAASHFDAEFERQLEVASPPLRASLVRAFPAHPAVARAAARALVAEAAHAPNAQALGALLALVENRELPNAQRLQSARTLLELTKGRKFEAETAAILSRLADVPSLPATLRGAAIGCVLEEGPASALQGLRPELVAEHLSLVLAAMQRSPEHRCAGARQLLATTTGKARFGFAGSLSPAELEFAVGALAELGEPSAPLELCIAAWDANPSEAILSAILAALRAHGTRLASFFSVLGGRSYANVVETLPRIAATMTDGALALVALFPNLWDAAAQRSVITALGTLGDARATDVLVGALASADDAVVDAAIAALAEVGDARALKALGRQAEGLFRDRARKAAARAAGERIRLRVGDPEGALALSAGGGELSLAPEKRGRGE